jgi:hypothetical protein
MAASMMLAAISAVRGALEPVMPAPIVAALERIHAPSKLRTDDRPPVAGATNLKAF